MGVPHIQAFLIPHETWQTDADNFDLLNGIGNVYTVTNALPWSGTIGRALIGHTDTIGTGEIQITQYPNGANTGEIVNPPVAFPDQAGAGILQVELNQAFNKDDGLIIGLNANTLQTRATRITLEITFDYV